MQMLSTYALIQEEKNLKVPIMVNQAISFLSKYMPKIKYHPP